MKFLKHYAYYIFLAILASSAVDIIFDSWVNYVLYAVLAYAIPLYEGFENATVFNIVYNPEVK